jgi:hypothetical protein
LKSRGEVFIDKQLNDAAKAVEKGNFKRLSEIAEKGLDHCIKNTSENNLFYHLDKDERSDNYQVVLRLEKSLSEFVGVCRSVPIIR